MDIHLPDFDGYEVACRIRGQQAEHHQGNSSDWLDDDEPVILAITAGVLQDNYAELLVTECDDII